MRIQYCHFIFVFWLHYYLNSPFTTNNILSSLGGFPDNSVGEESSCNAGDPGLIPGSGRSVGERDRLPTPVFWPEEFHGLYSPQGCKELDMTERFSLSFLFVQLYSFSPFSLPLLCFCCLKLFCCFTIIFLCCEFIIKLK